MPHVLCAVDLLIRRYRPADALALLAVFRSSVHGLGARAYRPEQLAAWAPDDLDEALWAQGLQRLQPFVLERAGRPVAYADLQPDGLIDHFYVAADQAGQGLGSTLMGHLLATARARSLTRLHAEVSRRAQPFFERWGFEVTAQTVAVRRGVALPNARMRRILPAGKLPPVN